jgi:hypothetical protein
METRRADRIDRGPCPRGLCKHIASMQVADGHCVVCAAKVETGDDGPCALAAQAQSPTGWHRVNAEPLN